MIEDFRLKVFDTLCRLGNFTAVAKELGISQPAVSQNIAELERQLGGKLFVRERGSVSLTDKGKLFKTYSDQILHWYGVAEEVFRGPSVFDVGSEAVKPVTIKLNDDSEAQIWASQGDLHISLKSR